MSEDKYSSAIANAYMGITDNSEDKNEPIEQADGDVENITTEVEDVNENQEPKNDDPAGIEKEEPQAEEKASEEPIKDEPQAEGIPSYSPDKFRELTEGKYESPEQLYQDYLKAQEEKETVFANDFIKKMNEYARNGVNIDSNFLSEISNDWKSMDVKDESNAKKMIAMKLRIDNPNLDSEDVEFKMRKTYNFDEEALRDRLEDKGYDDDKIEQMVAREKGDYLKQLEIDAKLAKPTLEKYQNELIMPRGASAEDLAQQRENERKEYMSDVANTLKGFDKLEFKLSDGESIEVPIDKELNSRLRNDLKTLFDQPEKFWAERGGIQGLAKMLAKEYAEGSVVKEFESRVKNKATYDTVKDLRNQKTISSESQGQQKPLTATGAIAEAYTSRQHY